MDRRKIHIQNGRRGSALATKIIPKSEKNRIVNILDYGTLIIGLQASSSMDKANIELKLILAERLDVLDPDNEVLDLGNRIMNY